VARKKILGTATVASRGRWRNSVTDFLMHDLVAGEVMEISTMEWLRSIRVLIEEEQRKIAPDASLISVLCDTVRYHREMMERFRVGQETSKALALKALLLSADFAWLKDRGGVTIYSFSDQVLVEWEDERRIEHRAWGANLHDVINTERGKT